MKKAVVALAVGALAAFSPFLAAEEANPLVKGDPEAGAALAGTCIACHGEQGNSPQAQWPNIAGQHAGYIFQQLRDYQSGDRTDPQMAPMVAGLSEQDMLDLAAYYSQQPHTVVGANDETLVERGRTIYMGGIPDKGVAACIACHGPAGEGNPAADYPVVGGQWSGYLADQLRRYRDGDRANDPHRMMRSLAEEMSDEEIEAVAEYMAGLH